MVLVHPSRVRPFARRPQGVFRLFPIALLAVALTIGGCTSDSITAQDLTPELAHSTDEGAASAQKHGSPADLVTLASFDVFSQQLPESIDVDRFGNLYVSMSPLRQIWKLNPDGSFEEIVAAFALEPGLFGVSGLRIDPRGDLYVAVSSTLPEMNGVWLIGSDGEKERIAGSGSIALPNDVAISTDGTLYITDSAAGAVWRYAPGGQAEMWVQHEALEGTGAFGLGVPIGANGIVVTPGKKTPLARRTGQESVGGVVVANSEKGQLVYVPVLPDGHAGEPAIVIADPGALFGLDGITVDARGTIYGAVNFAGTVVRISGDGSEFSELASGMPLDFPTSVAFGTGRDRHTLFITNFSIVHFLHDPPTLDDAHPAVISMRVDP